MTPFAIRAIQVAGLSVLLGSLVLAAEPELLKAPQRDDAPPPAPSWLGGMLKQWVGGSANGGAKVPPETYAPDSTRGPSGYGPKGSTLPALQLKGIAMDRKGAVAILAADGGSVSFVRAGDVVNVSSKSGTSSIALKIVRIERDNLVVEVGTTGRLLIVR